MRRDNRNTHWDPETPSQTEQVRRQHSRRGGHGAGFGPGLGRGFEGGAFFGPAWGPVFGHGGRRGGGRDRGPRVRRGDVRAAILDVLANQTGEGGEPNGYQVIRQIAERSNDAWRPSPGSVYPTIAQLEDEGLVESGSGAGRKTLRLTEEGRAYCAEHAEELAAVWRGFEEDEGAETDRSGLKRVIAQTMTAIWQLAVSGTPDQQERAIEVLTDARRRLYGILADGPEEE